MKWAFTELYESEPGPGEEEVASSVWRDFVNKTGDQTLQQAHSKCDMSNWSPLPPLKDLVLRGTPDDLKGYVLLSRRGRGFEGPCVVLKMRSDHTWEVEATKNGHESDLTPKPSEDLVAILNFLNPKAEEGGTGETRGRRPKRVVTGATILECMDSDGTKYRIADGKTVLPRVDFGDKIPSTPKRDGGSKVRGGNQKAAKKKRSSKKPQQSENETGGSQEEEEEEEF